VDKKKAWQGLKNIHAYFWNDFNSCIGTMFSMQLQYWPQTTWAWKRKCNDTTLRN